MLASQRRDLHLKHLNVVLDLQVQNGLVLNLEKCNFAQREIDYLGHKITPAGIVPLSHHIDALLLQPNPQDVHVLQRFQGMANFYRPFSTWDCQDSPPPHSCSSWESSPGPRKYKSPLISQICPSLRPFNHISFSVLQGVHSY